MRERLLQRLVIEPAEVPLAPHGRRDGGQCDQKLAAEILLQTIDESNGARKRHGFLDVEIESVETGPCQEVMQESVMRFKQVNFAVEFGERALRGAAEHAEDFDPVGLEGADFGP